MSSSRNRAHLSPSPLRTPFCRQRREVLLARLQRSHFLAGRAFEIHPEPEHRNEHPSDTGHNILRDLAAFFASEFFHFDIVGFDFRHDHCTSCIGVCDLNGCYGLRVATCAGNTRCGQCRDDERTHGFNPVQRKTDGDRVDTTLQRFLVALPASSDLFICAKDLFVAARTMGCSRHAASATGGATEGSASRSRTTSTVEVSLAVEAAC